jgi:2',3'-cyclic-nucleotide 2'-phosphodiesterase (5'-nucleotidase family)
MRIGKRLGTGATLAAAILVGCVPPQPAPSMAPDDGVVRVRVLHTNDFHGRLLPQDPGGPDGRMVGGSAVLAAHFDSARAHFDGATILVSGGDVMQGTALSNLSWGRAAIDAYNRKGYDAAAVGNHEFDWGQDTLRARITESEFPWLAANLYEAGTDRHPHWVRPWVMIERDGARVAVIGLALETTPRVVMAGRTDGLDFRSAPAAIDRYVPEARAAGADLVIVTAHIGATCDEPGSGPTEPSTGCRNRLMEVAGEATADVDLYVGGHTHLRNFTEVNGVPVMQALRYGLAFGVVDLERRNGVTRVLHREIRTPWADEVDADTAMLRVVDYWGDAVRPLTERVVASMARPLSNYDRQPGEFPLGSLIAEAQRAGAGAHVGFVNVGSIRRGLPAGPVSYGTLFELQPFQNEIVTVELTGSQLRDVLERALDADGRPRVHLSGIVVHYDPAAPRGSRIVAMELDDGRAISAADRVSVGTTEFVAAGGDGYAAFQQGEQTRTGLVDLDVLVTHLESLPQPVEPPPTGRWRPVR